jgi:hypothetical protein
MRGELLLMANDRLPMIDDRQTASRAIEVEACLERALDVAREQRARIFEVGAVMSLARCAFTSTKCAIWQMRCARWQRRWQRVL